MSATPETDAEHAQFAMGGFTMDFCRRMERERDEARFLLKAAQSALDAIHLEVGGWIKTMKENTD
jgi:hypothetical protein